MQLLPPSYLMICPSAMSRLLTAHSCASIQLWAQLWFRSSVKPNKLQVSASSLNPSASQLAKKGPTQALLAHSRQLRFFKKVLRQDLVQSCTHVTTITITTSTMTVVRVMIYVKLTTRPKQIQLPFCDRVSFLLPQAEGWTRLWC